MKLRYSSLKTTLLGAALLLLSAKGAQELAIDETFSLIINLPSWLVALTTVAVPVAAVLMAGFVVLAVAARKRIISSPALAAYVAVLAYYFLRSAAFGSNVQGNLLALVILLVFAFAISLDIGSNTTHGVASSRWITALSYFCHGYVAANFLLLIAGYGYSQVGSRFWGLTYHPNAEGAFAALCAGFFLVRIRCFEGRRKQRWMGFIFLACALFLVLASGSRTATLMAFLALICMLQVRYGALAGVATVLAIYFSPAPGTGASIGGAITRMITATTGNRDEVWGRLITDFVTHPILGVGDTTGVSGSGFLTAFAGSGMLGGLLFLSIFAIASNRSVNLVLEFRRSHRWDPRLVAAILLLQVLLGSIFEGTLFDKFSPFPLLTMIFLVAIWTKREGLIERMPEGETRHAS